MQVKSISFLTSQSENISGNYTLRVPNGMGGGNIGQSNTKVLTVIGNVNILPPTATHGLPRGPIRLFLKIVNSGEFTVSWVSSTDIEWDFSGQPAPVISSNSESYFEIQYVDGKFAIAPFVSAGGDTKGVTEDTNNVITVTDDGDNYVLTTPNIRFSSEGNSSGNVAIGKGAGPTNIDMFGSWGISIGEGAGASGGTGNDSFRNNINIGYHANNSSLGEYRVNVGYNAGRLSTATSDTNNRATVSIGYGAGEEAVGRSSVFIGENAGRSFGLTEGRNTPSSSVCIGNGSGWGNHANYLVAIGNTAAAGSFSDSLNWGDGVIAIGNGTGRGADHTMGSFYAANDIYIGSNSAQNSKSEGVNIHIGQSAGGGAYSRGCIYLGDQAGNSGTLRSELSSNVICIGSIAQAQGSSSIAVGNSADSGVGSSNTTIGKSISGFIGDRNVQLTNDTRRVLSGTIVKQGDDNIVLAQFSPIEGESSRNILIGRVLSEDPIWSYSNTVIKSISGSDNTIVGNRNDLGLTGTGNELTINNTLVVGRVVEGLTLTSNGYTTFDGLLTDYSGNTYLRNRKGTSSEQASSLRISTFDETDNDSGDIFLKTGASTSGNPGNISISIGGVDAAIFTEATNIAMASPGDALVLNSDKSSLVYSAPSVSDGSITTAKLSNNAVTTAKISNGSVTTLKMASMAAGTVLGNIGGSEAAPAAIKITDAVCNFKSPDYKFSLSVAPTARIEDTVGASETLSLSVPTALESVTRVVWYLTRKLVTGKRETATWFCASVRDSGHPLEIDESYKISGGDWTDAAVVSFAIVGDDIECRLLNDTAENGHVYSITASPSVEMFI